MVQTKRFIKFRGENIEINKSPEDSFWRDSEGCIYAEADLEAADYVDRCGIGLISLSENHPANRACKPHDFKYSSSVYQEFHTRKEADEDLERDIELLAEGDPSTAGDNKWWSILGKPFKAISRILGGNFWENGKTR